MLKRLVLHHQARVRHQALELDQAAHLLELIMARDLLLLQDRLQGLNSRQVTEDLLLLHEEPLRDRLNILLVMDDLPVLLVDHPVIANIQRVFKSLSFYYYCIILKMCRLLSSQRNKIEFQHAELRLLMVLIDLLTRGILKLKLGVGLTQAHSNRMRTVDIQDETHKRDNNKDEANQDMHPEELDDIIPKDNLKQTSFQSIIII